MTTMRAHVSLISSQKHTHTHNNNKFLIKKLCCTTRFYHVALLRFKLIFMDEADSPISSLSDGMHTKESGRLLIF